MFAGWTNTLSIHTGKAWSFFAKMHDVRFAQHQLQLAPLQDWTGIRNDNWRRTMGWSCCILHCIRIKQDNLYIYIISYAWFCMCFHLSFNNIRFRSHLRRCEYDTLNLIKRRSNNYINDPVTITFDYDRWGGRILCFWIGVTHLNLILRIQLLSHKTRVGCLECVTECCRIRKFHLSCKRGFLHISTSLFRIMIESSGKYPKDWQKCGKLETNCKSLLARRTWQLCVVVCHNHAERKLES